MKLKELKKLIKEEIQKLQEVENELGHSQGKCPDGMLYSPPNYSIPGFQGEGFCYTMLDSVDLSGMNVQGGGTTVPAVKIAPVKKMGKMNRPNIPIRKKFVNR